MKTKKTIMVIGASAIALAITGCGDVSDLMRVETIEVEGEPLDCVAIKHGYGAGVSCNWDAYNEGN